MSTIYLAVFPTKPVFLFLYLKIMHFLNLILQSLDSTSVPVADTSDCKLFQICAFSNWKENTEHMKFLPNIWVDIWHFIPHDHSLLPNSMLVFGPTSKQFYKSATVCGFSKTCKCAFCNKKNCNCNAFRKYWTPSLFFYILLCCSLMLKSLKNYNN